MPDVVPNIRLVIFDLAGTTVDFGSRAPVVAFVQTFRAHGVSVTEAEARVPMGLPKRDHLLAMLRLPAVAQRWQQAHGREWNENDLNKLYSAFAPEQLSVLDRHSALVPGAVSCAAELRRRGIRIATATGYFRAAAEHVRAGMAQQGFSADLAVCSDDVRAGRPAPWMVFRVMEALGVYPPAQVLKVGDTVPDIEEGRNAAAWSIGVLNSSSEVGCNEETFGRLAATERDPLLRAAHAKLNAAGAHAVLESLAGLPGLIDELNQSMGRGAKP